MLGTSKPWNDQTSVPSSLRISLRRDVRVLRGQVALEHVGRFHDVVVDAHDDQVVKLHARAAYRDRREFRTASTVVRGLGLHLDEVDVDARRRRHRVHDGPGDVGGLAAC